MANEPKNPGETSEKEHEIEDLQVADQDAAEQVKGGAEQVKESISLDYGRIEFKYKEQ